MFLHDLFDWTNAGVGAAGLALTAGAFWQATGAKKAAQEARDAVWKREAASSLAEIERIAAEFAVWVELERPKEAAVRGRDLAARIPRDRARFERFLNGDSDKLRLLESVYADLAVQVFSTAFLEDKGKLQAAIEDVNAANRELNEVYGRLLGRLDEEES
jgi:predicted alpha/beta hydrolase